MVLDAPDPVPEAAASDALLAQVYDELRRLAARYLKGERTGHTLQPTALVHEVWLRLGRSVGGDIADRHAFLCAAALAMRRVLVNHARNRGRQKRGGAVERLSLEDVHQPATPARGIDLLTLDEALSELTERDARKSHIVELRYFGGLSLEEVATATGTSLATVKREWTLARAWLLRRLEEGDTRAQ